MSTPIEDWLAQYDALDEDRKVIEDAMTEAEESCNYEHADSLRFDLWEKEAGLADSAAELLRTLHTNSNLPEKSWQHLDGSVCDSEVSQELPGVGICEDHDRRVNLVYADGRPAR